MQGREKASIVPVTRVTHPTPDFSVYYCRFYVQTVHQIHHAALPHKSTTEMNRNMCWTIT